MFIAIIAGLAMTMQDIIAVLEVQAEARNRPLITGVLDSFKWFAGITTTSISVTTLQGHSLHQKIAVICCVTAANFIGSFTGVMIGKKYIKQRS